MSNTKQVIVMRKDLNMRKGKMCAQAAHASIAFLTRSISGDGTTILLSEEESSWLDGSFRKICAYVNSAEELYDVFLAARKDGLTTHLVTDNGDTEFAGVPTDTCVAIGPHWEDRFSRVTDHLPLL